MSHCIIPGPNRRLGVRSKVLSLPTRWCGSALGVAAIVLACTGCQTFSLSEEDFQRQQRGGVADPQVGDAVAVVGTAAYMGAVIGAAAGAIR